MSKRFFASTQFFFTEHSPQGPDAFAAKTCRPVDFTFKGIRIASRPAASSGFSPLRVDGATLEFRDFATVDDAFEFCREFMVTLATRAGSQGAAISFSAVRHEHDSSNELWQTMPGINVRNVLALEFNTVTGSMEMERQYSGTPSDWLHDMMETAPMLHGDELEPALNAYALACGTPMLESRLLHFFAALEGLAGAPMVKEELIERISAFQAKVLNDPNYTLEEHQLLKILDGKKQKSQKVAVEELLRKTDAPEWLVKELNLAYKARGAYAHSAKSHEHLKDMTVVVEGLVISALADRVRRAKHAQVQL